MIRRPPRSTLDRSSAASDVYKRQIQNDIKRVVAYSTLSQLGYMTVALGASAYSAAVFHLMTHAFFKALPVSYTHLRAHETVLDLVCRLLLEKRTLLILRDESVGRKRE